MPADITGVIGEKHVAGRRDMLFYLSLAVILAFALFFRSQGYFDGNISFWWDEADWAHRLLTKPLGEVIRIRPIGYMFLTKLLVNAISTDETIFRLLSYLSSILALPLVYLIAKRLWNSRLIILLLLFLAAFNPNLITFAKEFKPYALDFFVHCALISLVLAYLGTKKNGFLYGLLLCAIAGVFFSYTIVFVYPAIFLLLLSDAYAGNNRKRLAILIATALIVCLALALMYVFIWSGMNMSREASYWGNKYDVFFLGTKVLERLQWIVSKYTGLVKSSAMATIFWPAASGLVPIVGAFLLFFHVVGILGFILERKIAYFLLFFLPIVTVILANAAGFWPFGPFRVNLFLMIYFLILTVNGFHFLLVSKKKAVHYGAGGMMLFLVVLQLPVNLHYYRIKPRHTWVAAQSDVRKALDTVIGYERALRARGYMRTGTVPVSADNHAYFATQYYLRDYPKAAYYNRALQQLQVKYLYVLSGLERTQYKGVATVLGTLQQLSDHPGVYRGESWFVIGYPPAIDKIEPIIDAMPDRVVFKKKFSYACLVVLLRT